MEEFDLIPQIGEIRKAGIGKNYQKEIYVPCSRCGQLRWVRLLRGQPRNDMCKSCQCAVRDKKLERICPVCKKSFRVHRYSVEMGQGVCCSFKCAMKYKVYPSGEKHPMWRGGKIRRICRECGREFEVCSAIIRKGKGIFCSQSCHMIYQRKHGQFCQTPNKVEKQLQELINKNHLPFKYVGNGEVYLGNRNPDFINTNGKKQVIELFGTYWHPVFDVSQRKEHYKQYGFDCLTVWEDELACPEKVTSKIKRFASVR